MPTPPADQKLKDALELLRAWGREQRDSNSITIPQSTTWFSLVSGLERLIEQRRTGV